MYFNINILFTAVGNILIAQRQTVSTITPVFDKDEAMVVITDSSTKIVKVCKTKHCRKLGKQFIQNRNLSVNPCENFYEYACGSWNKYNILHLSKPILLPVHNSQRKMHYLFKEMLEDEIKISDIPPVKAAKNIFHSCLQKDEIDKRGIDPIIEMLNKTGGWPLAMAIDEGKKTKLTWQTIDEYYFKLYGHSLLFSLSYNKFIDPGEILIQLNNALAVSLVNRIRLQKVLKGNDTYVNNIIRVALLIGEKNGQNLDVNRLTKDIVDMVTLEEQLLLIHSKVVKSSPTMSKYESMEIKDFQDWYDRQNISDSVGKINFTNILHYIFEVANMEFNDSETIVVVDKDFYEKIGKHFEQISKRVIVNLVQWNMIASLLPYVTREIWKPKFDTAHVDFNVTDFPPRWASCLARMKMDNVLSYMYLKHYLAPKAKQKAINMTLTLRDQLIDSIKSSNLNNYTKLRMQIRLRHLHIRIGYPNWMLNKTVIIEEYEGISTNSDYFSNVLNYKRYEFLRGIKNLKLSNNFAKWPVKPTDNNAYSFRLINAIVIPAAQFQVPYFTESMPKSVNYAGVGFIIAHELYHSIASTSLSLPAGLLKSYINNTNCFLNQYSKYKVNMDSQNESYIELNAERTLEENVADTVGLTVAYKAYKRDQKEDDFEIKLPGLESMSDDQLFFLSYANERCTLENEETLKYMVENTHHSPNSFRTIGAVSNMKEFAEAFDCPKETPMNPTIKCTLWE